ncbi:probable WRKY transcription factor 14 [Telopea speciosissima]|uniref:probable WRKY transcription factor 14 n=1 Tax=Telopea speciosissima TaxID=54955 RepID=UPI001CC382E1|nr:probable WRKY transcription factor 14 [Telopea speciosissima]
MCSLSWQMMENYQGDLADIVRAGGGGSSTNINPISDWQFSSEPTNFQSSTLDEQHVADDFGDPFVSSRDPLLHDLGISSSSSSSSSFFDHSNSSNNNLVKMNVHHHQESSSVTNSLLAQKILDEEMRPCNILSRMLQISSNTKMPVSSPGGNMSTTMVASSSPRGIKSSSLAASDHLLRVNGSTGCSIENAGLQIPSPRNPGIKRRKSQAKKVVCIPAPAAGNSRPTGEVVPSDLWAWRKYGQKPIKGSPYPRGYYRCSSSKGCSARKQVERSRTDPNMLVITYTSEHNHPWPTQRNALAGSTRSQPTKNNAASKISPSSQTQKSTNLKEEQKDNNTDSVSPTTINPEGLTASMAVKEEETESDKAVGMIDDTEFNQGFHQSYRPAPPDSNPSDDFFADLAELEPDPLNLLLSQGFSGEKMDEERENKGLDPFTLFDWTGNN